MIHIVHRSSKLLPGGGLSLSVQRWVFSTLLLIMSTAANPVPARADNKVASRVEDMSYGEVTFKVTVAPAKVEFDRDTLVTFRVSAASELVIEIPPVEDRLEGFVVSGSFDTEPHEERGKTTWERHVKLSPTLASTHRIAPMAVKVTDRSRNPVSVEWFATRPIVLEAVSPADGTANDEIESAIEPVWIHPTFTTVALWFAAAVGLILLIGASIWGLKRVHREVVLRRMSPRERAMRELEQLMRMDLIKQDKIKEFYLELTMIVRRYIERRHDIRAPEQTTEEFLVAVRNDVRFSRDVVLKLQTFLEAADLVKFAAHRPDNQAISSATSTATDYIKTDDAEVEEGVSRDRLSRSTESAEEIRRDV